MAFGSMRGGSGCIMRPLRLMSLRPLTPCAPPPGRGLVVSKTILHWWSCTGRKGAGSSAHPTAVKTSARLCHSRRDQVLERVQRPGGCALLAQYQFAGGRAEAAALSRVDEQRLDRGV